jgi:glycyl-tRNA synthetase beta chain
MDLTADSAGNVASGNAFVCNARFADASFFYDTDRKRTLESRVEDLSHLQFQEKLGDYLAKTQRILAIAEKIVSRIRNLEPATRNHVLKAARLCKTDLMTDMVKEFTELQGKIGGIYAREEGQPEQIWTAIYDHYMPIGAEDSVPRMESGAIVSLADRIDTLAGFFLLGMKPTGSRDPFALRRTAQGAVQILLAREPWSLDLSIDDLVDFGLGAHNADAAAASKAKTELLEFFADRVRTQLEATYAYDEIAAAMGARWSDSLLDLEDRARALRDVRLRPEFLSILRSAKRIENITEGHEVGSLDASKLEHPTETRLAELSALLGEQIGEMVAARDYPGALESFAGMAEELERFFVDVMVMVEDEALRRNRMALLRQVGSAVGKIAEVTKIVIDRADYQ